MIDKTKFKKALKDKYSFKDETFLRVANDNPKDKLEVEVGDSKQPDFKPQVKVQRWDNEVNLSFRLKDDGAEVETVDTVADRIVWKKGKREAYFYDLQNDEHPDGAYEFEVVLLEKPDTNVVEFSLNTKGLDFFYQPALTPEEIEQGNARPENVVGSYAVYASEEKINYTDGKEYKTGKVGHIYRPQIEDSNGNKVWGELNVDTENGILSVTIPQEFLDNAAYPVRHAAGLTFGYTSAGASDLTSGSSTDTEGAMIGTAITGTLTDISGYFKKIVAFGGGMTWTLRLKNSSSGAPGNTNHASSGPTAANETTYSLKTASVSYSMTGSDYWIYGYPAYNGEPGALAYDSSGGSAGANAVRYDFGSWSTANSYRISVYATYTAGGGGTTNSSIMMMGLGT